MEFRWVAVITLWTTLIGPIVGSPSSPTSSAHHTVKTVKAVPVSAPAHRR
jgi:hypothetical protein